MPKKINSYFENLAEFVSSIVGSPYWFAWSLLVIIMWFPSKFVFKSEELWHLFINTFTTILTFLMMSLLHSSQSKWEKKIEEMEKKQGKMLRILERDTEQIKFTLSTQATQVNSQVIDDTSTDTETALKNEENAPVTSLH